MADKGVDALVLLGNGNVSYATGATWPLSDAGRANVERPVAVVLADDEMPHLFTPFLADAGRGARAGRRPPARPDLPRLRRGRRGLRRRSSADLVPPTAPRSRSTS